MAQYKCLSCSKKVTDEYVKTRVRCPYCGSKMLYKERTATTKVIAR